MLLVYHRQIPGVDRKPLLEVTPFKEMLDKKWAQFAFYYFVLSFGYYILYLLAICLAVIRPQGLLDAQGNRTPFLYVCEVFIVLTSFISIVQEIVDLATLRKRYFSEEGLLPPPLPLLLLLLLVAWLPCSSIFSCFCSSSTYST